jgi:hypothetical protein
VIASSRSSCTLYRKGGLAPHTSFTSFVETSLLTSSQPITASRLPVYSPVPFSVHFPTRPRWPRTSAGHQHIPHACTSVVLHFIRCYFALFRSTIHDALEYTRNVNPPVDSYHSRYTTHMATVARSGRDQHISLQSLPGISGYEVQIGTTADC